MKRQKKVLIGAAVLIWAIVSVVARNHIKSRARLGLPIGPQTEKWSEPGFESGVILPFSRMVAVHAPRFGYCVANHKVYAAPKGVFPFFEEAINKKEWIAFVNDDPLGAEVIVVINRLTGVVLEMPVARNELGGIGLDAGSKVFASDDEVKYIEASHSLEWTRKDDVGAAVWLIDLVRRRVEKR